MGLDLYFKKRKYVQDGAVRKLCKAYLDGKDFSVMVDVELCYWRKNWDLANYLNLENCKNHYVEKEDIQGFIDILKEALDDDSEIDPVGYYTGNGSELINKNHITTDIEFFENILDIWDDNAEYYFFAWW